MEHAFGFSSLTRKSKSLPFSHPLEIELLARANLRNVTKGLTARKECVTGIILQQHRPA